jgi:hypothetical protein
MLCRPSGAYKHLTAFIAMTSSPNHDSEDADLQRMLRSVVEPAQITDHEQLLACDANRELTNAQTTRILETAQQLIHNTDRSEPTNRITRHAATGSHSTEIVMKRIVDNTNSQRHQRGAITALIVSSLTLVAVLITTTRHSIDTQTQNTAEQHQRLEKVRSDWMRARATKPVRIERVSVGRTITTDETQRRRIGLPDGSVLFVNKDTQFTVVSARRLEVQRASAVLDWTRDLICAAGSILPASPHAGGSIITIDPSGQETKLSLRKYHIDVHIEDGFARSTIDQTYFNHTSSRLEGTFYFPLPPDASLSRLAMYVNGKLMEGGMAERQHARNTFEQIVTKQKDPARLDWVDGSTFKMRVFPLEARQEKRIVLSYTQRLDTAYKKTSYRFPAGHNMDVVRDWSASVRVKDSSGDRWDSPSHTLTASTDGKDLILEGEESDSRMDRDLVVELKNQGTADEHTAWTTVEHEDYRYLMLRHRSRLPTEAHRPRRNWIVLFESSGDRDPLLARTQIEVIRTLLDNAEHSDTFSIVAANTKATIFEEQSVPCSAVNIANAMEFLERTHLIGALNLEQALQKSAEFIADGNVKNMLIHTGAALPMLGEHRQSELLKQMPKNTAYVGVGVGKRWSQQFMKQAAGKTGGYFTQINPDEDTTWRAFELSSALNAPRLLNVKVATNAGSDHLPFLSVADTVIHGEEICAVMRVAKGAILPKSVTIKGTLNGQPWQTKQVVEDIQEDVTYLPRTWAKMEIDRLVALDTQANKQPYIELSKSMYVMSPYTSLLVLENEAMYAQYSIDRGCKDHWVLYPCPDEIKVVSEPLRPNGRPVATVDGNETTRILQSVTSFRRPTRRHVPAGWFSDDIDKNRRGNGFDLGIPVDTVNRDFIASPMRFRLPALSSLNVDSHALDLNFYTRHSGSDWTNRFIATEGGQPTATSEEGKLMPRILGIMASDAERSERVSRGWGRVQLPHRRPTLGGLIHFNTNGNLNQFGSLGVWTAAEQFSLTNTLTADNDGDGIHEGIWMDLYYPSAPTPISQGLGQQVVDWYSNSATVAYPTGHRTAEFPSLGQFYPYSQVPLGWREAKLQWGDGVWDLNFNKQNSVWDQLFNRNNGPRLQQAMAPNLGTFVPNGINGRYAGHYSTPDITNWPDPLLWNANAVKEMAPVSTARAFCDLIAHAPGMNTTTADALHVLESEGAADDLHGSVDESAAQLINQARSTQWEKLTLPAADIEPAFAVTCNGEGQYVWTRFVSESLEEQVICDGETLLHLYPEIGLGARREYSRFHAETIRALVPWLLPSVE